MTTLVVGASGATGRLLVQQLLDRGQQVKAIVRTSAQLPQALIDHPQLSVVRASLSDLGVAELAAQVQGCGAVASCLGHTMSWKGIYGRPRRLVADAVHRLCAAIRAGDPQTAVKFVLMNTAGNRNRDLPEPRSLAERCAIGLVRALVPPHADNEAAADYLRTRAGAGDAAIEWAVVRPDSLIDENQVSVYELHPSPIRSPIFNAGRTSRINVGHFMAELITDDQTWRRWQGRMPAIYNKASS